MAGHVRQQICNAVATLITGLTTTGDRVFIGRTRSLATGHLPAWLVYGRSELSDVDNMGSGNRLARTLDLAIEGRVNSSKPNAAEDVEALLNQMAAEAEVAMAADFSLGGLAREVTLTSTQLQVIANEVHEGMIVLRYRIGYRTLESDPTQI